MLYDSRLKSLLTRISDRGMIIRRLHADRSLGNWLSFHLDAVYFDAGVLRSAWTGTGFKFWLYLCRNFLLLHLLDWIAIALVSQYSWQTFCWLISSTIWSDLVRYFLLWCRSLIELCSLGDLDICRHTSWVYVCILLYGLCGSLAFAKLERTLSRNAILADFSTSNPHFTRIQPQLALVITFNRIVKWKLRFCASRLFKCRSGARFRQLTLCRLSWINFLTTITSALKTLHQVFNHGLFVLSRID